MRLSKVSDAALGCLWLPCCSRERYTEGWVKRSWPKNLLGTDNPLPKQDRGQNQFRSSVMQRQSMDATSLRTVETFWCFGDEA